MRHNDPNNGELLDTWMSRVEDAVALLMDGMQDRATDTLRHLAGEMGRTLLDQRKKPPTSIPIHIHETTARTRRQQQIAS